MLFILIYINIAHAQLLRRFFFRRWDKARFLPLLKILQQHIIQSNIMQSDSTELNRYRESSWTIHFSVVFFPFYFQILAKTFILSSQKFDVLFIFFFLFASLGYYFFLCVICFCFMAINFLD